EIGKLEIGLFRSQLMTDLVSNRDQDAVIVARLSHRQQDQMLTVLQPVGDLLGRFLSPEFRETLLDILDFQRHLLELVLPDNVFRIYPAELPQNQDQAENIGKGGDHKLHQNGLGIRATHVVSASDEYRDVGRDGGNQRVVQSRRPAAMRKRQRPGKPEQDFQN